MSADEEHVPIMEEVNEEHAQEDDEGDLFGDTVDAISEPREEHEEEQEQEQVEVERASDDDGQNTEVSEDQTRSHRRAELEYEEEEAGALGEDVARAISGDAPPASEVQMANLPQFSPWRGQPQVYQAKLPNFLSLAYKPFDAEAFREDPDGIFNKTGDDDMPDENFLRWRWQHHSSTQTQYKQSNSRFVRWSDGSYSLQVGGELFDVNRDEYATNGSGVQNHPVYLAMSQEEQGLSTLEKPISGQFSFLVNEVASKAHRRYMTRLGAAAERRTAKLVAVEADPEKEKDAKVRTEREQGRRRAAPKTTKARPRRSGRSQRLDLLSDEEDAEDDFDEDLHERRTRTSARRPRTDQGYDEDDFVVEDEDEDAGGDEEDEDIFGTSGGEPSAVAPAIDDQTRRRGVIESDEE